MNAETMNAIAVLIPIRNRVARNSCAISRNVAPPLRRRAPAGEPAPHSCNSASAKIPVMHQNTTSHAGASRPRKESSSIGNAALQQSWLIVTTGDGQKIDRISRATNAADASRRLASIDIEPLSNHLQLVDVAVVPQCRRDFV